MRQRIILPFLLAFGLILYFPILRMGFFILDDANIVAYTRGLSGTSLQELFQGGGTYYRPIAMLSYLADIRLWDGHPGLMHLVNVIIHILNSVLVYWNVRVCYQPDKDKIQILSLCAAILFLVHPINTESINWISGRTDPLSAFFVLIATYLVLTSMKQANTYFLWLASLFMVLGSMSKEVGFFCFPAILIFFILYKSKQHPPTPIVNWRWRLAAIMPFTLGGITYFIMRSGSLKHVDKGVSTVTDLQSYQHPVNVAQQFITDFGYYVKKLFIPQPLTLAIDNIHPNYFWLGLITIILFIFVIFTRNYHMGIALLIAFTIFPALLNAFLKIAWTPYAERYLYLPCAFFCIGIALPNFFTKRNTNRIHVYLLVLLICIFLPTTVNRNLLWAKPLELTRLTHQQSPENPTVWSMYAVMLANQEHYNEARMEFNKVLLKHPDHLFTHESRASMEMYIDAPDAARDALESFFNKELTPNRDILNVMLNCNQERLKRSKEQDSKKIIRTELIDTQLILYARDDRYERLIEVANLAILNEDFDTAEESLKALLQRVEVPTETITKATNLLKTLTRKD